MHGTEVKTIYNVTKFDVLSTECIQVICVDLNTSRDYLPIRHYLTGFYNREGECLLRGTDWVFKYNSDQSSSLKTQTKKSSVPICMFSQSHSKYTPVCNKS